MAAAVLTAVVSSAASGASGTARGFVAADPHAATATTIPKPTSARVMRARVGPINTRCSSRPAVSMGGRREVAPYNSRRVNADETALVLAKSEGQGELPTSTR